MLVCKEGGSVVTDKYAHNLFQTHLIDWGILKWNDWLTNSKGQVQGMQYKSPNKKVTVNIYLPKGTVYITAKKDSIHLRDELMHYISQFTQPKEQ